jgi:hypothetical protein
MTAESEAFAPPATPGNTVATGHDERALQDTAALDHAHLVDRVDDLGAERAAVDLVGHADMTLLNGNLVRGDLLGQRDDADAEEQDRSAERGSDQRCVEGVPVLFVALVDRPVAGRPDDEQHDEGDAEEGGQ